MSKSETLPYLNGYGYIDKVLEAIKPVPAPPKFTQNFLETKLGIKSTSARPIIPFLKKIGFLTEGGVPTDRYKTYRNSTHSGRMAKDGLLDGYSKIYEFNEYAHDLNESELEDLIVQATNSEKGQVSRNITKSFLTLKSLADFSNTVDTATILENDSKETNPVTISDGYKQNKPQNNNAQGSTGVGMNLSYTINLNLPETTNAEVFDAIFQSLNRNILKPNG